MAGQDIRQAAGKGEDQKARAVVPVADWQGPVGQLFDGFFPAAFGRSLGGAEPWAAQPLKKLAEPCPSRDVADCADTSDFDEQD